MAMTNPAVGVLLLALLSPSLVLSRMLGEDQPAFQNPPGSTGCPDFPPSSAPANSANEAEVVAAGWVSGKFYDYRAEVPQGPGPVYYGVYEGTGAGDCYKRAVCKEGSDISYVSWVARTNSETKGHCHFFASDTCNPMYLNGVNPFIPGVVDWYTTQVDKNNMDFCEELCGQEPEWCRSQY